MFDVDGEGDGSSDGVPGEGQVCDQHVNNGGLGLSPDQR